MIKTKQITKDYEPAIGDLIVDPSDESLGVVFKTIIKGDKTSWAVHWTHMQGSTSGNLETTESVCTLEAFLLIEA
jgi:hypothetical protein